MPYSLTEYLEGLGQLGSFFRRVPSEMLDERHPLSHPSHVRI